MVSIPGRAEDEGRGRGLDSASGTVSKQKTHNKEVSEYSAVLATVVDVRCQMSEIQIMYIHYIHDPHTYIHVMYYMYHVYR